MKRRNDPPVGYSHRLATQPWVTGHRHPRGVSTKNRKLTFKPYEMNQPMLLPPSLDELVPKRKATCLSHDSCCAVSKRCRKGAHRMGTALHPTQPSQVGYGCTRIRRRTFAVACLSTSKR